MNSNSWQDTPSITKTKTANEKFFIFMSLIFRAGTRSLVRGICARPRAVGALSLLRCNSTTTAAAAVQKPDHKLAAEVYPLDKNTISEADVDQWLGSLQRLKTGQAPDNEAEVYISQLTETEEHLQQVFEPTEEQLAQVAKFENIRVPLKTYPVVDNLVNLIMRDGKKSKAQKIVSRALYIVFLKLRKDPIQVLEETLDKLGPLLATRVEKTGTAKNKVVPYPLNEKQRNRYAILWILDGASKKKSSDFSVRLAEELISAHEGKSSGYDKKAQMHKAAIAQRAYIKL